MAKNPGKADSVYDFFFVDSRRIGQLLSQFGQDGILTELTRSAGTTGELGGDVDLKVAKVEGKKGSTTALARRFDPQWLLPLGFLKIAHDMIQFDPTKAGIGDFVMVTGSLALVDMSIIKGFIDDPNFRKVFFPQHAPSGSRKERRASGVSTNISPEALAIEQGMAVMGLLPHLVQIRMEQAGGYYWASVAEDGLTTSPADVLLKHGIHIAGEWNAVAILDAVPDVKESEYVSKARAAKDTATMGAYIGALVGMTPVVRPLLGRPAHAYGITPLLIYREVNRG